MEFLVNMIEANVLAARDGERGALQKASCYADRADRLASSYEGPPEPATQSLLYAALARAEMIADAIEIGDTDVAGPKEVCAAHKRLKDAIERDWKTWEGLPGTPQATRDNHLFLARLLRARSLLERYIAMHPATSTCSGNANAEDAIKAILDAGEEASKMRSDEKANNRTEVLITLVETYGVRLGPKKPSSSQQGPLVALEKKLEAQATAACRGVNGADGGVDTGAGVNERDPRFRLMCAWLSSDAGTPSAQGKCPWTHELANDLRTSCEGKRWAPLVRLRHRYCQDMNDVASGDAVTAAMYRFVQRLHERR
ncbi:MAG: hypothetical protein QM820_04650 [Minicystis sp.]